MIIIYKFNEIVNNSAISEAGLFGKPFQIQLRTGSSDTELIDLALVPHYWIKRLWPGSILSNMGTQIFQPQRRNNVLFAALQPIPPSLSPLLHIKKLETAYKF